MKMYATTTSERASKGQGGNEFIRVNFAIGSKDNSQEVMSIVLDKEGRFTIRDKNHGVFKVIEIQGLLLKEVPTELEKWDVMDKEFPEGIKGNKEKGEVINEFGCTKIRCICGRSCNQ